jgi:hypothetical protein
MEPTRNSDVRWKKNAATFLIVYSILAAIASVILTTIIAGDTSYALKHYWWATVLPLAVAIFLFIYTAEKIVDALDEDDVYRYVSLFNFYNIAVILLFEGLFATIYLRYIFSECGFYLRQFIYLALTIGVFIALIWRWLLHEKWLLTVSERTFEEYIDELEERVKPEFDRQWGYHLFMGIRRRFAKKDIEPKFAALRFELRRSSIDGIGLFASKTFPAGSFIAEGITDEDLRHLVTWKVFSSLDEAVKEKVQAFCVGTPLGFVPPPDFDFNKLTPEWYMNHSCNGKVGFDEKGNFIARRDIAIGKELTFDYGLAESYPEFSMECTCGCEGCRKTITGDDWQDPEFRKLNRAYLLPHLR